MRLDYTVRVSGVTLLLSADPQVEINDAINRGMKDLYDSGCRRMIAAIRLPKTGDGERYTLTGWNASEWPNYL